jgi:hypothetical protein
VSLVVGAKELSGSPLDVWFYGLLHDFGVVEYIEGVVPLRNYRENHHSNIQQISIRKPVKIVQQTKQLRTP